MTEEEKLFIQSIKEQFKNNINIMTQDIDGNTLLHKAVENHYPSAIQFLIDKKPKLLGIKNENRLTAKELAMSIGNQAVINVILGEELTSLIVLEPNVNDHTTRHFLKHG